MRIESVAVTLLIGLASRLIDSAFW